MTTSSDTRARAHTHIDTFVHIDMVNTYIHLLTHTHTRTHARTRTRKRIHTFIRINTPAHASTYIHSYMFLCRLTHTRALTRAHAPLAAFRFHHTTHSVVGTLGWRCFHPPLCHTQHNGRPNASHRVLFRPHDHTRTAFTLRLVCNQSESAGPDCTLRHPSLN
jgi:hypothetical protein